MLTIALSTIAISLLFMAMVQDIQHRQVSHTLTLAMLALTVVHACLKSDYSGLFILALTLTSICSFLFWQFGIWGGNDSKWLVLSLVWLPLPSWVDWCFIFSIILVGYLIFSQLKRRDSLALLLPMNSASITLIAFYQF